MTQQGGADPWGFAPRAAPRRRRLVPLWSAVGLAVAAPLLGWWAIGNQDEPSGLDYQFGPYHLPILLEQIVGSIAVVIAASALLGIELAAVRRACRHTVTAGATLCLLAAGLLGAACWRVATASSSEVNIGGSFAMFVGPVAIATLLWTAVQLEQGSRGGTLPRSKLLTRLAVSVGVVLLALPFALTR